MMRYVVFSLLLAFSYLADGQTKSVLFIGNSYTAVNNLPNLVYNIALANGDTILYDSNTPGGSYFNGHKTNPTTLAKIGSTNWDVVVLQEQSQLPTLPIEIAGVDYSPPSAADLCELIRENDTCTDIVFYMTWGRKTGDASYCAEVPAVCTYEGMQLALRDAYLGFAEDNNAVVAPAGMAWKSVIDDDPLIELYSGDESHPNINGSYLTACVFYATLYQKSPIGNTFTAGLTDELANYLQTAAHNIVFDSLETWHIGEYDLTAEFDFTKVFFTATFENTGEGTTLEWIIDGEIYTEENPAHTFPGNGYYDVTLTVYDACDTVSITESVLIGIDDVGVHSADADSYSFYPNPVDDLLYVNVGNSTLPSFSIYTLSGICIGHFNTNEPVDLSHLSSGIYLIKVADATFKLVKN